MANQYQEPCTYEIEMGGRKRGAFPRSSLLLEDCRSRGDSSPLLVASILADVSAVSCVQAYPESTVLPCVCGGGCSNLAGSLAKRWALLRSQTADSNRKPRRESCGLTNGTWNLGGGAVRATPLTGAGVHSAPLDCAPDCRLARQLASVGLTAVPRCHYLTTRMKCPCMQ